MLHSTQLIHCSNETQMRKAALVAGFGLLAMVILGPFAEFYAYGSLMVWGDATATAQNIRDNETQFLIGILCYLLMFACDFLLAWALHILLKPVNALLSLLAAWLRVIYGILIIAALTNVFNVLDLIHPTGYLATMKQEQLDTQLMLHIDSFGTGSYVAFLFFSTYLVLLGYLVFKSGYIPKILGVLLIVNGLGYFIDYFLRPFVFTGLEIGSILMVTFFGEVIFMIWLLIKGFNPKQTFSEVKIQ